MMFEHGMLDSFHGFLTRRMLGLLWIGFPPRNHYHNHIKLGSGLQPMWLAEATAWRRFQQPHWKVQDHDVWGRCPGVGKCPILGILDITFKYLLEIISPILGWCSIGTFNDPCCLRFSQQLPCTASQLVKLIWETRGISYWYVMG